MQIHLSLTLHATEISNCSSGQCIWNWYYWLTTHAIKQVPASYPAPTFAFVFPHFLTPQISRYGKWTLYHNFFFQTLQVLLFLLRNNNLTCVTKSMSTQDKSNIQSRLGLENNIMTCKNVPTYTP